jgi:hypothetical protein
MSEKQKTEAVGAAKPKHSPQGRFLLNEIYAITSPTALSSAPENGIDSISATASNVAASTPRV